MADIAPFPKIPLYRAEADLVHAVRRVVAVEKIDGTNTRIGLTRAQVAAGNVDPMVGGRVLMEDDKGFAQPFLGPLVRSHHALRGGLERLVREWDADVVLYGEVCGGRIQRMGFIYGARPHFVLFGAKIAGAWLSWSRAVVSGDAARRSLPTLVQLSALLEVPMPPLLYEGEPSEEHFRGLIDRPSAYSLAVGFDRRDVDRSQEGIVIWPDPLLLSPDGHPIVAKLKHPHRRESVDSHRAEGLDDFATRVMPAERIHHAVEYLQAAGKWPEDPDAQVERVVRRAIQDVAKEDPGYEERIARHGKKPTRTALERAARATAVAILRVS